MYLHLGPPRPATGAVAGRKAVAEVDPDQEAALRRLRAAFGFAEVLRIVDHHDGRDQDDHQPSTRARSYHL